MLVRLAQVISAPEAALLPSAARLVCHWHMPCNLNHLSGMHPLDILPILHIDRHCSSLVMAPTHHNGKGQATLHAHSVLHS